MTTTFTAWVTTDAHAAETDICDVAVRANDGGSTSDPVWKAVTTMPQALADRDDDALFVQAEKMLAAAGWKATSDWGDVPTGYAIHVERS